MVSPDVNEETTSSVNTVSYLIKYSLSKCCCIFPAVKPDDRPTCGDLVVSLNIRYCALIELDQSLDTSANYQVT